MYKLTACSARMALRRGQHNVCFCCKRSHEMRLWGRCRPSIKWSSGPTTATAPALVGSKRRYAVRASLRRPCELAKVLVERVVPHYAKHKRFKVVAKSAISTWNAISGQIGGNILEVQLLCRHR